MLKLDGYPRVESFHFFGRGVATRSGARRIYFLKFIMHARTRKGGYSMEEVFKLNKSQKIKSNKIHKAIIDQMKENGTHKEPYIDIAERYMAMWEVTMMLEEDIRDRGVQIMTEKGLKKNDSVAMLTNLNKQMLICLEKLGLSTSTVKHELGGDI